MRYIKLLGQTISGDGTALRYVANHKNDYKDTEAIIEVGTRPRTKFVQIKTIEQQDIQSIHRVRERLVNNRICLSNQIRGLLLEYGVVIPQGFSSLKSKIIELLSPECDLTSNFRVYYLIACKTEWVHIGVLYTAPGNVPSG